MSKRPGLRAALPQQRDEAAEAVAVAAKLAQRVPAVGDGDKPPMTTTTIHLPVDLLRALRAAAERRSASRMMEDPKGRGGRPSVSEVVVEMLQRHRDEIDGYQ